MARVGYVPGCTPAPHDTCTHTTLQYLSKTACSCPRAALQTRGGSAVLTKPRIAHWAPASIEHNDAVGRRSQKDITILVVRLM